MTIHRDFKKNLVRKNAGAHRRQAERTIKSLSLFVVASQNLLDNWEDLVDETGSLDYGSVNYPKAWGDFDVEISLILKWTNSFRDQLRKIK